MQRAVALAILFASGIARAEGVDVADLPPLPPAEDQPTSEATLLAAASADEDVVVGAAKREQSLGNVASAVTVITADRIRRFGYRTVAEAIAGVAGVYLEDNRLTTQVGIRGLQIPGGFNSRLLLLVDGATVNEAWGAFAGVGWDGLVSIDDVARIEVIRGPVGAVYGTNAFFAIINIVTRGAETQRAWGRIGIGSINGEVASAGFAAGGVDRQLRGSVTAMNRIGDSSSIPGIGSGLDSDGAYTLGASLVGSYGGSFAQLRAYRSRRDSPFAPYDSDPALDPAYSLYNNQLILEGGHTRELSKRLTVAARGYFNLYRYQDKIHYAANDEFFDYGDARTIGAEVRARYDLVPNRVGLTAGAEANHNTTKSRAFSENDPSTGKTIPLDFNIEGVYAELDGQITEWLGVTGGARFDNNSVIDKRVSPRGALFLAKPERYGLKLLYAEGFRNPSAFEGFFEDGVDFSANPDIKSETIRSLEAVLWAKPFPGLSTRLSGFYWDARDIAEQRPDPDDPSLLQFQNVGRYVSEGVEAEASYRNSLGWYAFGGAALSRVGTGADGMSIAYGKVVNAPTIVASGGISTPKLYALGHLSLEGVLIGRRLTRPQEDGSASAASPAWFGMNATIYLPSVRGFDVTAGVRNILGKRDLMPAPGDYDRFPDMQPAVIVPRIPGEGREVYVKVGLAY